MTPEEREAVLSMFGTEHGESGDHRPAVKKDGFECPRCGHFAHQSWEGLHLGVERVSDDLRWRWQASVCVRCGLPTLWYDGNIVFPLARLGKAAHRDMPAEVRELYEEAARVAAVSRRAGAALARATVERLIKHLDPEAPKGANLAGRIERIKARGVSTPVGQMLDVVRVTGNEALHSEQPGELAVMVLDDVEGPAMLEFLLETANDLVDELITRPAVTGDLWNKLPDGIKSKLTKPGSSTSS
ncbi:DUF4145 domain-containing protein [Actinokineospora sp. NPDC004072]